MTARIPRPQNGAAPGMPVARRSARKRRTDALDKVLAVTRRHTAPVSALPRIILPWPATELWPNRQKGRSWRYSYAAKRAQVDATCAACIAAGLHFISPTPGEIRIKWIACPPSGGSWDGDGLEGALKAARDTIARALGVDDAIFDARVLRGERCRDGAVIVEMEVVA